MNLCINTHAVLHFMTENSRSHLLPKMQTMWIIPPWCGEKGLKHRAYARRFVWSGPAFLFDSACIPNPSQRGFAISYPTTISPATISPPNFLSTSRLSKLQDPERSVLRPLQNKNKSNHYTAKMAGQPSNWCYQWSQRAPQSGSTAPAALFQV